MEIELKEKIQKLQSFERVIGHYSRDIKGPMVMVMAGVHGNEQAGIYALNRIFEWMHRTQPQIKGHFVGLAGNLTALHAGTRFIDTDLNRRWTKEQVRETVRKPFDQLTLVEEREQKTLIETALRFLRLRRTDFLFLDLHTTSAFGGEFSITNAQINSIKNALTLKVPVITGLSGKIKGTTLQFFEDKKLPAMGFEAGQHDDPKSILNMEAAIWSVLESTGCMLAEDIPEFKLQKHRLEVLGSNLPEIVRLLHRQHVEPESEFVMRPGYVNFQPIKMGEHLADDKNGPIYSLYDGLMLMPLYQSKGEDGFFIIEEIDKSHFDL